VAIEYRWAEGRTERFSDIADEFVRIKADVIVTQGTATVIAAKQATSVIPIVFASAGDPVATGLVASLSRPGGNVTGLSSQGGDTVGKRFELLREIVPDLQRLAILGNIGNSFTAMEMNEVETAARTLGLDIAIGEIRRAEDIAPAFEAFKSRANALYVATDPVTLTRRTQIHTLALVARLPATAAFREFVEAGFLLSYGANIPNQFRQAADYVDKILHGAKAGDIPVEQPTKFDLVINLTTAKALGITVPTSVIARADDLIE